MENNTQNQSSQSIKTLAIGAMGVVFGDIGTSPLYALRECFSGSHTLELNALNILGIVSLIIWTLILIISIEYLSFILNADNKGEGGVLALMTLLTRLRKSDSRKIQLGFIFIGLFATAMIYGDGIITPAISVLSAVEGLNTATQIFRPYVVPISIGILTMLFMFQRNGTEKVGTIFGPVMILWFATLGVMGIRWIAAYPQVLAAINPWYAVSFFINHGWSGFMILGTVFLAITGAEAIYADIGHFGKTPIRIAWFSCVLPGLVLNYFGQAAYLLKHPENIDNLFYRLAPEWALYPVVIIATCATIIASQAVISGSFSITRQAVQLGYLPRLEIIHTSNTKIGQVYIPSINAWLFIGTSLLIIGFGHSGNLASAYGIAVSFTMFVTTFLTAFIAHKLWKLKLWIIIPLASLFLVIDGSFFTANIMKFFSGGWIPLMIAAVIFSIMLIWQQGRRILRANLESQALGVDIFIRDISVHQPIRVPGVAVFLTGNPNGVPRTLLHNFKHNKILHEHTVLVTVRTEEIPRIPENERTDFEELGAGIYRVIVKYGFSEDPNIPQILKRIESDKLKFDMMKTTFFLGRETLLPGKARGMAKWRKKLFVFLSHNAFDATQFYRIPPNNVIELGIQIIL